MAFETKHARVGNGRAVHAVRVTISPRDGTTMSYYVPCNVRGNHAPDALQYTDDEITCRKCLKRWEANWAPRGAR